MTVTAPLAFAQRIDTGVSGFVAVRWLAQWADEGSGALVSVETERYEATGHTAGMVEYFERLGVPTEQLADDYRRHGPRSDPEHLYMTDVLVEFRDGKLQTRPALRVRVREIRTCRC